MQPSGSRHSRGRTPTRADRRRRVERHIGICMQKRKPVLVSREPGTSLERIGDESLTRQDSCFVRRNIWSGRSSVTPHAESGNRPSSSSSQRKPVLRLLAARRSTPNPPGPRKRLNFISLSQQIPNGGAAGQDGALHHSSKCGTNRRRIGSRRKFLLRSPQHLGLVPGARDEAAARTCRGRSRLSGRH